MDSFFGYSPLQTGMGQQSPQNVNTSHAAQQIFSETTLQQLQPGDTFQGEIMSVNGQEVQLQLANGMYMVARLEGEVQLALGQILNFQVQSNQNSKLVLKPVYANLLQQRVGEAALKAASLAVNDKNLQMVSKLIENGMPIDKNSLALFNRQLLQHPQVNVDSLIRLHQLGVKITDANLIQLEHYQNLEHKLLDGIQDAVSDIGGLYETIANGSEMIGEQGVSLIKADSFMEQVVRALAELSDTNGISKDATGAGTVNGSLPLQEEQAQNAEMSAHNGKAEETVLSGDMNPQVNTSTKRSVIMQQLEGMSEGQVADKLESLMKQGELDINTLKELLFPAQESGMKLSAENRDRLFRSEGFREILKDSLQKEWSLMPEELTEDGKVKEFYQKLLQQSQKLAQIMEQAAAQNQTNTGNALQNIRENIEFMNQMNQMFQYVQLPLKLSGSQAQGELYVYTNKRNLAKKDGMLTAVLHLDMEHLGNMDIQISLNMDTEQVVNKFYLEEDSVSLLEEHIEELAERLTKKGYHSQSFLEKRVSEKTVFEQIEEQAGGMAAPLVYQNFDMRT